MLSTMLSTDVLTNCTHSFKTPIYK